jgi:hypothetical protein
MTVALRPLKSGSVRGAAPRFRHHCVSSGLRKFGKWALNQRVRPSLTKQQPGMSTAVFNVKCGALKNDEIFVV